MSQELHEENEKSLLEQAAEEAEPNYTPNETFTCSHCNGMFFGREVGMIPGTGKVCKVCWEMYITVYTSNYFLNLHMEYAIEQAKKRRMILGGDYA